MALAFLTVFPVAPGPRAPTGPARAYFPAVGLALGGIVAAIDLGARQVLPSPVVGALLMVAILVLTRAIHTEGFLDTCDGLLGGSTKAKRLSILRDTHIGAFAAIGGAALLIAKWAALSEVPAGLRPELLIVFPCLSRFGMLIAMAAFPYARREGVGTPFQVDANWTQIAFGIATAGGAAWLFMGFGGLAVLCGVVVMSLGIGRWVAGMLGGMTGDTYGAVNEICEVVVLVLGIALYGALPEFLGAPLW